MGLKAPSASYDFVIAIFKSAGSDVGGRSRDKAFRILSLVALRQEGGETVIERKAPE